MSDTTTSIVTVLNDMIDAKIDTTKSLTINQVLLYKAGSNLVAIDLGKVSY